MKNCFFEASARNVFVWKKNKKFFFGGGGGEGKYKNFFHWVENRFFQVSVKYFSVEKMIIFG